MNEDKSSRYHRLGRRARILSAMWTGAILLGVLLSGAGTALGQAAHRWADGGPTGAAGLYIAILFFLIEAATLPFVFFRGFVLERRYGLGTETLSHWVADHLKALCIGFVFAELGGLFVYTALRAWPDRWWIAAGAGYSLVTVVLANLAPVLLLPMFFAFKPLDRAGLRDRLTALARRAGTRIVGVYEWTLSDRTRKANAALTGIGNTRRILLSDTLLAEYSDDEIEVILAHELAHHVHRDIWASIVLDTVIAFAICFAAHHVLLAAAPVLGLRDAADPAGLPVLLLTASIAGLFVRPFTNAISREHERRADAYALQMTNNPAAFITAMKRLGQQNLAEEDPSRLVQAFFYTHPPIKERLKAARQRAAA